MSLISAITSKGHMRFMIWEKGGVNAAVLIEFLKRLIADADRPIFLIVDRGPARRAKKTQAFVGRLFWKLFLVIWLAMSGTFAVGFVLYSFGLEIGPKFAIARTEAQFAAPLKRAVELEGPDTVRSLQNAWSTPPFDLVISVRLLRPGETPSSENGYTCVARASHNGSDYVISVAPDSAKMPWQLFTKPYITAAVIGLIAALLLARHLSRPIQLLRLALHSVAEGRFETRISPLMGARRDELADLGHEADRMAAQLQQFSERQKRLLHDVSHELRSPLARMKAAARLARQNPARLPDMMNRVDREVERLDVLVEEILTLARLETMKSAEVTLERTRVDLIDILTAIIEDAEFEGQSRRDRDRARTLDRERPGLSPGNAATNPRQSEFDPRRPRACSSR